MICIKDKNTSSLVKYVKTKHSKIQVNTEKISGDVQIKSIRKYSCANVRNYDYFQVDVIFRGKIFAKTYSGASREFNFKDLPRISKIRTFRFMRHFLLPELNSHLAKFGIDLRRPSDISKIKWVE